MQALLLALLLLSSDWQVYQDDSAGYAVEYPADWSVDYGDELTQFTSPSGRVGITVGTGPLDQPDGADLPGVRCTAVTVAEVPTQTCQDILSFSVWTNIPSRDRVYTVATSAKGFPASEYEHVLASFTLLNP